MLSARTFAFTAVVMVLVALVVGKCRPARYFVRTETDTNSSRCNFRGDYLQDIWAHDIGCSRTGMHPENQRCICAMAFAGQTCEQCVPGFSGYPYCVYTTTASPSTPCPTSPTATMTASPNTTTDTNTLHPNATTTGWPNYTTFSPNWTEPVTTGTVAPTAGFTVHVYVVIQAAALVEILTSGALCSAVCPLLVRSLLRDLARCLGVTNVAIKSLELDEAGKVRVDLDVTLQSSSAALRLANAAHSLTQNGAALEYTTTTLRQSIGAGEPTVRVASGGFEGADAVESSAFASSFMCVVSAAAALLAIILPSALMS